MKESIIIVDSSNRNKTLYPSNNSWTYTNNRTYKNPKEISLIGAIFPNSQYVINSNNYKFNVTSGATQYTANLTLGNYTPSSLATELQTDLNALAIPSTTFTVTVNTNNFTFTITSTAAVVYNFSQNTTLAAILGFPSTNSGSVSSITSSYAYNINTTRYYKVFIKELPTDYDTNINQNFNFIILNNSNSGGYTFLTNSNNVNNCLEISRDINLATLTIQMLDEFGNLVQLNGLDYILTLKIKY